MLKRKMVTAASIVDIALPLDSRPFRAASIASRVKFWHRLSVQPSLDAPRRCREKAMIRCLPSEANKLILFQRYKGCGRLLLRR